MSRFIILLRGINVGGKNKVSMAELKACLEELGCQDVITYINSGNVILRSELNQDELGQKIELLLPTKFNLDSSVIKVLVLTKEQMQNILDNKPAGFGEQPTKYYCDVIFLMDIDANEAFGVFNPREGVDKVWKGTEVIYSQRLSTERTKSRLSRITLSPLYKSMTIRSWNTTVKIFELLN